MEITTDVNLIKTGDKVGASEATLLAKLGIKPFSYGLIVDYVSIHKTSVVAAITVRRHRCLQHGSVQDELCPQIRRQGVQLSVA